MQMSMLLETRRKTYILDVICSRICFGEVQEQLSGQCRKYIQEIYFTLLYFTSAVGRVSQHPQQKVYLSTWSYNTKQE